MRLYVEIPNSTKTVLTLRGGGRLPNRAATLLFFLIIALPLLFFSAGLAVDATKIIVAARQTSNAAEASAVAGAQQFTEIPAPQGSCGTTSKCSYYTLSLDKTSARSVSLAAVTKALAVRAIKNADATGVVISNNIYGTERVAVTIKYSVPNLVFLPVINALLGGGSSSKNSVVLVVTRYADVCQSTSNAEYVPTAGFCTRPTVDPKA